MSESETPNERREEKQTDYLASKGREDRHGEMTGAISINMIFCGIIVVAWGIFIGPAFFESLGTQGHVVIAIILAIICPFAFLKPSQMIWARLSKIADNFELD